ncbi:MAG: ABC transporter ATP-binding protein/permease [Erysipelotrichaceae bacterium]|nr:ABC transporter ATP-binding protein/permease [Erysipelotrichaceae bacterium]
MLEIKNVQKYFHRGKRNQIHVINNTSLSFKEKGLIALLGPSGCGKTTLLNAIGGLDKIKSGSIYINGQKISSRRMNKVDKIRNLSIGYIFQDYKLIENLSVYDNVSIVLKMLGIKDKQIIKERVEYVLDKVGMLRYQKRPANMLSGGERQRVGIARAIVKSPDIILADEPTGNLDSKNTLEIMKIIKAISQERLVILVTHEQDLAKFYASRIIEIEDGTIIKDYENDQDGKLDYRQDSTFYLKDFKNHLDLKILKDLEEKKNSNVDVQIFSEGKIDLQLDIVLRNGNIYLRSKTPAKVEVVDEDSSIEFIDGHYQELEKKNIHEYQFDDSILKLGQKKRKYTSIYHLSRFITAGFESVFNFSILKKFLLVGFFLAGMFIMYSVSSISSALQIKETDFMDTTRDYLLIEQGKVSLENYQEYEQIEGVEYLLPGTSQITVTVPFEHYYQTNRGTGRFTASLASLEKLNHSYLIFGRMPKEKNEVVIDKIVLDKALEDNEIFQMVGMTKIEDFLNQTIKVRYMDDFIIVGISNQASPSIYVKKEMMMNVIANSSQSDNSSYYDSYYGEENENTKDSLLLDYTLYQDKITLTKGRMPEGDYEVIVEYTNEDAMPLNKEINVTVNDKKLVVVGYYDSKESYSYYLVNSKTIEYQTILKNTKITLSVNNKEQVMEVLQDKNINVKDCYQVSKKKYMTKKQEEIKTTIVVSGIILAISLIEIFLMIRSSFLSRIKEIGVFRAIGIKVSDIYKMFSGEIIAITTIAGVPGLLFMAYILSILSQINYLSSYIMINSQLILLSILFLYLFNLIIGLIPVYHTIKKRPAEILSRYDLD